MKKSPRIILILEPNSETFSIYNGATESSGFITKMSFTEKEFAQDCLGIIPDIVVINTEAIENYESLIKKVRKIDFLVNIPIILLMEKIGFSTEQKAKKLKVSIIEYPIKTNRYLQEVKKLTKDTGFKQVFFNNSEPTIRIHIHGELKELGEDKFRFNTPAKMNKFGRVYIESKLFASLGVLSNRFEATMKGKMLESKVYRNEVDFRGLSLDALKNVRKYYHSHKANKS